MTSDSGAASDVGLDTDGSTDDPDDRSTAQGRPRSLIDRAGLTPVDATVLIVTAALFCLFLPSMMFSSWTPRMALLALIAPFGLSVLAVLVLRRDRAAIVLLVAALWVTLAALLSPSPRSALLGFAGRDLSALVFVAVCGCWALGRAMSARGREVLAPVAVWAGAVNAVIGLLQVVLDVDTGDLALAAGRPTGFSSNPVYFGALCATALIGAIASSHSGRMRRMVLPMLAAGVGVSLSGSRVALMATVAVFALLLVARRDMRTVRGVLVGVTSLVLGVLIDRIAGAGRNAVDRLSGGEGGGRTAVWRYGLDAVGDRPIWGHGFGMFRPAVQDKFSAEFVSRFARDEISQAWFDPHNVVIGLLVGVGVVGVVMLGTWVVLHGVSVRGPLAWMLVPIVLHWMLQPVSLYTLPLAMILFGAAAPRLAEVSVLPRRDVAVAAGGLGLVLGSLLVVADVGLRSAADDLDGPRAERFAGLLLDDSIANDIVAQVYGARGDETQELEWRRRAAESEPDRPYWWSLVARAQIDARMLDEAERSLAEAYELQPNNIRTLRTEMLLALVKGDEARLAGLLERSCELEMDECEFDAAELIAGIAPPAEDANGG